MQDKLLSEEIECQVAESDHFSTIGGTGSTIYEILVEENDVEKAKRIVKEYTKNEVYKENYKQPMNKTRMIATVFGFIAVIIIVGTLIVDIIGI